MPPFNQKIHIIMKLSILSFLVLSILGGTWVMAKPPILCGHGVRRTPQDPCFCFEGYAGSVPKDNCFETYFSPSLNRTIVNGLQAKKDCDIWCGWFLGEDPNANYPCITEERRVCRK
jgi:hypothetical protein